MMAILLNCVTLGMYQPCSDDETCTTSRCKILQTFDDIIFGFFAIEMVIKMLAMGIMNAPNSYLSDTWNRLDFFIVVAGALEYCLDVGNMNLSAIRTVRVLRPLRAINRIPSMRILVMLLLDTLPMLGNVLLLCFFVFFIFGIIGVQLWAGLLRQRCFLSLPANTTIPSDRPDHHHIKEIYMARKFRLYTISLYYQDEDDNEKDYICSMDKDNGMHRCSNLPKSRYYHLLCTEQARPLPELNEPNDSSCVDWNQYYTDCRPGDHNPFQDAVSFDNVGMAWIAIFLVISLEGWSDIMYYIQDAHSFWSWIYFVLLIVIGSFFMINLCLVVIATQFSETKKREMERMRQERARCHSLNSLASFSLNEQLNCYGAIIQYLSYLIRKISRNLTRWYLKRYGRKKHRFKSISTNHPHLHHHHHLQKYYCHCNSESVIGKNIHHEISSGGGGGDQCSAIVVMSTTANKDHHHYSSSRNRKKSSTTSTSNTSNVPIGGVSVNVNMPQQQPPSLTIDNNGDMSVVNVDDYHQQSAINNDDLIVISPTKSPETSKKSARKTKKTNQKKIHKRSNSSDINKQQQQQSPSSSLSPSSIGHDVDHDGGSISKNSLLLISDSHHHSHSHHVNDSIPSFYSFTDNPNQQRNPAYSCMITSNHLHSKSISCHGHDHQPLASQLSHPILTEFNDDDNNGHRQSSPCKCRRQYHRSGGHRGHQQQPQHYHRRGHGRSKNDLSDRFSCSSSLSQSRSYNNNRYSGRNRRSRQSSMISIGSCNDQFERCFCCCCPTSCTKPIAETWKYLRCRLKTMVKHNYFQQAIFLAILLNTFSMGIEYHNQPQSLSHAVEISNIIFTIVFCFEMLLKLLADGFYQYIKSGFNVFDGCIVILSLLELLEEHGSGLSVLRTFRLLRILKLVRFMPALRRQLVIMLRTIDNVAVFFALLMLFIFIFSILGMNLFGCKFCDRNPIDQTLQCDRKNFDSLLWALVTVFQILTQEDWNVVLFNGMERSSPYAALYFVALMTFGNYVLFNLLVAILVEGFSQEDEMKRSTSDSNDPVDRQIKQERLIYFYSHNDDLEREIQTLEQNPTNRSVDDRSIVYHHHSISSKKSISNQGSTGGGVASNRNNESINNRMLPEISIGSMTRPLSSSAAAAAQTDMMAPAAITSSITATTTGLIPPPLITRTAATPQGSPPTSSISISEQGFFPQFPQIVSIPTNSVKSSIDLPLPQSSPLPSTSLSSSLSIDDHHQQQPQHHHQSMLIVSLKDGESNYNQPPITTTSMILPSSPLPTIEGSTIKQRPKTKRQYSTNIDDSHSAIIQPFHGFPLRKELSCIQIRNLGLDSEQPTAVTAITKRPVTAKQRRKSFFQFRQRSSQGSMSANEQNKTTLATTDQNIIGEDTFCPIYARKNIVLRRKSLAADMLLRSRSKSIQHDDNVDDYRQWNQQPPMTTGRPTIDIHYPSISISSNMSADFIGGGDRRKNSLIHEIRVLSPRNSLKGIFYSSSVISIRNSNEFPNDNNDGDEMVKQQQRSSLSSSSSIIHTAAETATTAEAMDKKLSSKKSKTKKASELNEKIRKFCIYFKWTSWMTIREDYSLFIFSPSNRFRRYCTWIADHPYFDYIVLIFISMNCVTLAMERPKIPPNSREREFLNVANFVFTLVFGIEMLVKVIAKGLFYGRNAYFHNGWNIMDGSLVGISLLDIFLSFVAQRSPRIFGILRVFRLLRSLRPLRVINRAPGLKLVVQTLLSSLRPIGNIVLICCTFFIIFGILGVQLFKGSFYYCDGPKAKHVRNKLECLSDPRNQWINRKYNFDNLGQALMSLFVLSSKDGWVNIMYTGLDAVGVDQQPIENYNEWRLLYFISFLLLVAFFVLNMFVGVVVENFHRCRREQEQEEKAFRALKRAEKMEKRRKKMREPPYFIGYGKIRLNIHRIVTGKYFDLIIALVIGLNVITMSLEHYMMPMELEFALKLFNFIFTSVFIVEAIMKAVALGLKRYLTDKWNQLDVIIVSLSIMGIILEEMESTFIPINPTIIRVMRVARIARVLKLLKMAKGIRQLLDTVMQALPQVGNLGLLFFLLFFIFAALGTELFGRLECDEEHPCQGLGEHAHFQNFGMAFLTLFRVATGDNWNGIMKDTLRDKCDPSSDCLRNCCISPVIAPLYFVIFVLMAQFVLVNVVVAVLMKHLEESHHQMNEDEDFEIDQEIAREIEAERKALAEAIERRKREKSLKVRRPLLKMASLPSNFTFTLADETTTPMTPPPAQPGYRPTIIKSLSNNFDTTTSSSLKNRSSSKKKTKNSLQMKNNNNQNHQQNIMDSSISLNNDDDGRSNYFNFPPSTTTTNKLTKLNGILKKSHSLKVAKTSTTMNGKTSEQNCLLVTIPKPKHGHGHLLSSKSMIDNFNDLKLSNDDQSRRFVDSISGFNSNHPNPNRQSSIIQSPPVMIKIDDCYPTSNNNNNNTIDEKIDPKSEMMIIDHHGNDNGGGGSSGLHLGSDLLTTTNVTTTTTIASPSRIQKYRKLSDFLDEESGPLSPALFRTYPELFNSDTNTYNDNDDLNEDLNDDDNDQQSSKQQNQNNNNNKKIDNNKINDNDQDNTSLASIESWPSGDPDD
ncbi:ca[2+]-channel protein alpha[[1]] subunit T isoform X1 [Dermatophagoides pteronyssinus]|uniref:ca[2+]-channel protein alpha[[1]] subunit T isoform X1 n=1 Tax=Dermatophagoides pteronyssinus TaxID=6956 RepID=UPI003F66EC6F